MSSTEARFGGISVIGITDEQIEWEDQLVNSFLQDSESTDSYIEATLSRMLDRQPALFTYLFCGITPSPIADSVAFHLSAATAFNMIPEETSNDQLTDDDIWDFHQDLLDDSIDTERGKIVNLGKTLKRMGETEQPLFAYIKEMEEELPQPDLVEAFVAATVLTIGPFLLRQDTRGLGNNQSGNASLST